MSERQPITFDDILKVKDKLDAMDISKSKPIEIKANSMTVDLILKDVEVAELDGKDVAWGLIGYIPLGGIPIIKDETIEDYFVKVGEFWYRLNLGASGKVISVNRYESKNQPNEKEKTD